MLRWTPEGNSGQLHELVTGERQSTTFRNNCLVGWVKNTRAGVLNVTPGAVFDCQILFVGAQSGPTY